ncbi:MAG: D-psicose 3-epimerase [Aggregatilineales bacterium]
MMTNKIGIYYAYWVHEWDADFHPFIDRVADLGFDVLEVNSGTVTGMTAGQRQALKKHADDRGISLSYCIGLPHMYDIASPDGQVRNSGIVYLQQMAKAIGELGGGNLGGIIYGSWPGGLPPGTTDRRPYVERSIASMRKAIKAAEDNNVMFNVEVVNRFEQYVMNTCAEAIEYVKRVESPNAKILLDTYHMNIEEDFVSSAILQAGDWLGHFHIGENNRMPPGYGHVPWTEIGAALRQINYCGYVVMEPFLQPGGQVGSDIKVYRDLSVGLDLDDEARKALMFVRGFLK